MMLARFVLLWVASDMLFAAGVTAQSGRVVATVPAANATIETRSTGFSVRFERPVDHVRSLLFIKRDGKIVEALHPRFKTAPDVLFAQAPALPPGDYALVWQVRTLSDAAVADGEIPFRVVSSP
jgi:methionine-rich copper-binding protein CopC